MDFSSLLDFFKNFETGKVFQQLQDLKLGELIHNPWFLGTIAVIAVIAMIMRWRVLLALVLSVTGFVALISYTLDQETQVQRLNDASILVFVGGFVCLLILVIYLLFIKGE